MLVYDCRSRLREGDEDAAKKHVVIFGAGRVSAPLIEYLHRDANVAITVASEMKDQCDELARKYPGVESSYLNAANNPQGLQELISKADVAVSILPYHLHHIVAEACIKERTNMVTASYVNDKVRELHKQAAEAGITILNEVGLDPGIDHLLALECIDDVKAMGGRITSFESFCGGLPAPEFSDNPLRYKFSWSPRGALLNTLSGARYLRKGQVVEISAGGELMAATKSLDFLPGFHLEGFPNRDSTLYTKYYGIQEASTVLRGTIRYAGFAEAARTLQLLGLLDTKPHPYLHAQGPDITWRKLLSHILGFEDLSLLHDNLKQKITERTGTEFAVELLEELELLEDKMVIKCDTPLDTLTHYLANRLALGPNERDLVVLRHDVGIAWPDNKKEIRGINFVVYGDVTGHSAMAKTVGFPAAIATKMILDGEIQEKGVILPFAAEIYRPILSRLRNEGLHATETSKFVS